MMERGEQAPAGGGRAAGGGAPPHHRGDSREGAQTYSAIVTELNRRRIKAVQEGQQVARDDRHAAMQAHRGASAASEG